MEKETIEAVFTKYDSTSNWCKGTVGPYEFSAKVFDEPSSFGIKNGRVSKLGIGNWTNGEREVVNYDRGWDIKPTKEVKPYFNAVMKLLENAPKRFENHD